LCCEFHRQVHIFGEFGTNTPHVPGTAQPPGPTEPTCAVGPAGAAGPTWWHDPGLEHPHSLEHNLDECDSLKKRRFDQMVEARFTWINGFTYPIAQPPQQSSKGDPSHSLTWSVHHTA
jgi:hypothetical protein